MTVTKVFAHRGDLDGWASAAIVLSNTGPKPEVHLVEYGEPFPADVIQQHDKVVILDFCPDDPNVVQEIIEKSSVFWWIDHHVSSRRMVEENNFLDLLSPPSAFITDSEENPMAACELAYMFFKKVEYKDIPYHIRLLGRFDIWDHTSDRQVLPFQYAMRAYLDAPTKDMQKWKKLIKPSKTDLELFKKLIEAGTYIKMYDDKKNAALSKQLCFEMDFEGYRTIAVNRIFESSFFFKEVYDTRRHDLMLPFGWTGDHWKLSFRTDKENVDCSKLAEKYFGGGHSQSSGATVKELPESLKGFICK